MAQPPVIAAYSPRSSREPIEFGIAAGRLIGAPLIVVTVRRGDPGTDDGDQLLGHPFAGAQARTYQDHTPARGLARAIDELRPQLMVVGSTGGAGLGNTAERVIQAAACPVALVPKGYAPPTAGVRMIGVAFVETAEGRHALRAGAQLARAGAARLRVITVLHPGGAATELHAAVADLGPGPDTEVEVLVDDPAEGLIAASRPLDMLVIGSCATGPRSAVMLGSVSRTVAGRCACPLLILPRASRPSRDGPLALHGDRSGL